MRSGSHCFSPAAQWIAFMDVGRLVDRVDDLADLLDLGDQLAVLLLGRLAGEDQARVAVAPAAIVEGDDQVAGPGERDRVGPQDSPPCRPSRGS